VPAGDKPRDVPLSKVGTEYRLIGKLHEPLGTVMTVQGVIVHGDMKIDAGKHLILVQRIDGRATQEDLTIEVQKGWTEFGADPPKPEYGVSVELNGYEAGGFIGVPDDALRGLNLRPAVPGHHFRHRFVFHAGRLIDPVRWTPADFVGREALIEGTAVSRDRRAYIVGAGWRLLVDADAGWPKGTDGKAVEGFGTVRKADAADTYRLEKATTRLVHLRDQLGQPVALRGTAWSMNGEWWLDYRGTSLYVEGMKDLPGWKTELHAEPVLITGVLDEAVLPALDQITLKSNPDKKKYYIVRKPAWKPLGVLLSPERVGR